jgi:nicotinamidase-related amidase
MALDIDLRHTAVLSMDFENDIVHPEGALKEFGFAKMVADNNVLEKTGQLLVAARGSGVLVIHVSVKFRVGYPERPPTPCSGRDSTPPVRCWKAPGAHRDPRPGGPAAK